MRFWRDVGEAMMDGFRMQRRRDQTRVVPLMPLHMMVYGGSERPMFGWYFHEVV